MQRRASTLALACVLTTSCGLEIIGTATSFDEDGGARSDAGATPEGATGDAASTTCVAGQILCSGSCTDVNVDHAHCGACDHACGSTETCAGGTCVPSCGDGRVTCSSGGASSCVDLKKDPTHCGGCDVACKQGQACTKGACADVITVSVSGGAGSATVVSDVGGIACPPTCSAIVPTGTKVTLTAGPPADEVLRDWSGACLGRDPTCAVIVDGPKTASASFAQLANYMHSATTLYKVAGATGAPTSVGTFGGGCSGVNVGDIAINRAGAAYAITQPAGGGDGSLFTLDLATAACGASALGGLGRRCNALTFAPDPSAPTKDVLFAACTTAFYRVNLATGATTSVGNLGGTSSGDIVWVPGKGIFITLTGGGGGDLLGNINVATGAATVIGSGVGVSNVYALGWRGGQIIGYADGVAIRIDPATGAGTSLNGATGVSAFGAAAGP